MTSTKEVKVGAVREAFQTVFGRATVVGAVRTFIFLHSKRGFQVKLRASVSSGANLRSYSVENEFRRG